MLFYEPGTTTIDIAQFEEYARIDYNSTKDAQGTGVYQCFCEYENVSYYTVSNTTNPCYTYSQDIGTAYLLAQVVSYSIVVVNILLRSVNIFFIKRVGLHTISEEIRVIMTAIFASTFINTAILLLLTNANFEYSVFSFIPLKQ